MARRIVSLSIKLTATTALLVLLVTSLLAVLVLQSFREDVERQTERLVQIRTESLDRVGASTARYLALPAASPMYDNDVGALYGLVLPVVREESVDDVVYGYIVDNDGTVWIAVVDEAYASLFVPGTGADGAPLFQASGDEREPELVRSVPTTFLEAYQDVALPIREDVERTLVTVEGVEEVRTLQQYTAAIVDRRGESLGILTLAYSLDNLAAEVDEIREAGDARQDALGQRIALLGGLAAVFGCLIAVLQALAITRNVKKLSRAAQKIAMGDLSVRANVRSRDEIGALGQKFNVMADRVQALLVETEQKASLERELSIARMIQEQLVPPPGRTERNGVAFAGYFESASICGGDFWQHHALAGDDVLLTIGDVTGHGVPSTMISAAARSGLDTILNVKEGVVEVSALLHELNNTIFDTAQRSLVMTFLAVKLSRGSGQISLANAGHNFPLVVSAGEGSRAAVRPLVARGNRLGDERGSEFEALTDALVAGDMLFLYTDGLTEYVGPDGSEYGERRLRRLLTRLGPDEPETVVQAVVDDLHGFAGDAPQLDDITIVVARV